MTPRRRDLAGLATALGAPAETPKATQAIEDAAEAIKVLEDSGVEVSPEDAKTLESVVEKAAEAETTTTTTTSKGSSSGCSAGFGGAAALFLTLALAVRKARR